MLVLMKPGVFCVNMKLKVEMLMNAYHWGSGGCCQQKNKGQSDSDGPRPAILR